jgi:hypothetical protein
MNFECLLIKITRILSSKLQNKFSKKLESCEDLYNVIQKVNGNLRAENSLIALQSFCFFLIRFPLLDENLPLK